LSAASILTALAGIAIGTIGALMYVLSLYFQDPAGFGMSAFEAGVATLPAAAAMIAITPLITPLAVKIGTRMAIAGGFGLAAAGFAALAFVESSWSYAVFVLPLVLVSAGLGLANGPASSASTAVVAEEQVGQASGISNMARYVGGSLWVAAIATIYNGVIKDRTEAGDTPADALAAGLARGSVFLAICAGAGIALVLLMARHKQPQQRAVDRAAAAAVTTHTIPIRPRPTASATTEASSPGTT